MSFLKCVPLRIISLFILAISLNACAEFGWNPLDSTFIPEEEKRTLPEPEQVRFDLIVLEDAIPVITEKKIYEPAPLLQRHFKWKDGNRFSPYGEFILSHSLDTNPAPQAVDPKKVIYTFPIFKNKKIRYLGYYQSENKLGPIKWRRIAYGPEICVIFQQNWEESLITGYYCAGDANILSAGQAETVIQSITVAHLAQ